jgi:hypothetical protein
VKESNIFRLPFFYPTSFIHKHECFLSIQFAFTCAPFDFSDKDQLPLHEFHERDGALSPKYHQALSMYAVWCFACVRPMYFVFFGLVKVLVLESLSNW